MATVFRERVRGIEPLASAWKAEVLPLYDTRKVQHEVYRNTQKDQAKLWYTVVTESMESTLARQAFSWATAEHAAVNDLPFDLYCQTRDVFQGRLDAMSQEFLRASRISEDTIYMLIAIAGEIGNNSFDHNVGSWKDVPGIFFGYSVGQIVLADRGCGIRATLQRVKPELRSDEQALETAFKEKLSGRAPENRGNGLKFVRQAIQDQHLCLQLYSGNARAELNAAITIQTASQSVPGCLAVLAFSDTVQI